MAATYPGMDQSAPWASSGLVNPAGGSRTPGEIGSTWPGQTSAGTGVAQVPTQNGVVSTVQSPTTNEALPAYTQAITAGLQPTFDQQTAALKEKLNAMGILPSGSAIQQLGDLTAQQGATIASDVSPLIAQGFQNQNTNAQQNASALNAYQQLIQQQSYGAGINNQNNQLQASEFNAGQQQQANLSNMSADEALQLAQLGYGNADYMQMIGQQGGLTGATLGAGNTNAVGGSTNATGAYLNTPTSGSAGYNTPGTGVNLSTLFGSGANPQPQPQGGYTGPAPLGSSGWFDTTINNGSLNAPGYQSAFAGQN
jgi:hypothetical protein